MITHREVLWNSVAIVNLRQHNRVVTERDQVVTCGLAIALLIIVIYPWTTILPAPHLKYSSALALMPGSVTAALFGTILLLRLHFSFFSAVCPHPVTERLALICTRLC